MKRALPVVVATLLLSSPLAASADYGVENLARGRPVTALTNTVLGAPASVVDGNVGTSWFSFQGGYRNAHAFVIDLGAAYDVGKIQLMLVQVSEYVVSTSLDNVTFTPRHARTGHSLVAPVALAADGAYAARYVKLESWSDGGMFTGTSEIEVYEWQPAPLPPPPGTLGAVNLALGKPITNFSGSADPAHPPGHAVDGNDATAWISPATSTWRTSVVLYHGYGSAVIDLGQAYPLGRIVVKPHGLHWYWVVMSETFTPGATYPVDTNAPWLFASAPELFSTTSTTSAPATFDLQGRATARYLYLLTFTSSVPAGPVSPGLAEIEVYEWRADDPPPPATCEADLAAVQQSLNVCTTDLQTASAQASQLQSQLNVATNQLAQCGVDLAAAEQTIASLTAAIDGGTAGVEQILQRLFGDAGFRLPGATTTEQLQNLIDAILNLNRGRLEGLYTNLGGKPGR